MEEFEDDINNIDLNSSYSSVLGSYLNTNETSELEENNFASTSTETSSNATSYFNFGRKKRKSNLNPPSLVGTIQHKNQSHTTKPYPYAHKGDNTSNLFAHLHDKHKITIDNYRQFLDETSEPNIDQTKLTEFVEALYILEDEDFCEFVNGYEPGYRIPCELISNMAACVHLTTDLWTAKSKYSYIGVTGTWLTEDFEFKEVLLTCSNLPPPYSGEIINNATNMIKGVHILKSQLSEAQRLYEAQLQIKSTNISDNQNENYKFDLLNVLNETKTHWNSRKLSDTDDSSSVSEDKNIPLAVKCQYWQFAHYQSQASNITSENNTLGDDNFFAAIFNLGGSNNDVIEFDKNEHKSDLFDTCNKCNKWNKLHLFL
ncbi:6337_t:CDS:2 [Gigaspora margarita]|uniref:6337_t:CDS:1 n=1 Tax=Gigaspora margarita TaxID=4874 RepID=A0ABM8VVN7_GIGMA|nr:6337_t:CDS:2 [Gigaspora margarita]